MLLLHVGLPKAGSSSLQAVLRRAVPPDSRLLAHEPGEDACFPRGRRLVLSGLVRGVDGIAPGELERLQGIVASPSTTLVVSYELFTMPYRMLTAEERHRSPAASRAARPGGTVPIAERVATAVATLDPGGRSTRVVAQIRRPDAWLASYFASGFPNAYEIGAPLAASDLGRFVDGWLGLPDHGRQDVLDNAWLDATLSGVVGRDRVTFLPLHTFGSEQYWNSLTAGTPLDAAMFEDAYREDARPQNVRVGDAGAWVPDRGTRIPMLLRTRGLIDRLRSPNARLLRRTVNALTGRRHPSPFTLDEGVQRRILDRYGSTNRTFATDRSLELDGHGYW
jgi:hypothetical protein